MSYIIIAVEMNAGIKKKICKITSPLSIILLLNTKTAKNTVSKLTVRNGNMIIPLYEKK